MDEETAGDPWGTCLNQIEWALYDLQDAIGALETRLAQIRAAAAGKEDAQTWRTLSQDIYEVLSRAMVLDDIEPPEGTPA